MNMLKRIMSYVLSLISQIESIIYSNLLNIVDLLNYYVDKVDTYESIKFILRPMKWIILLEN